MNKPIYFGAVAVILAFTLIYASVANAQNVTTNASNAITFCKSVLKPAINS